MQGLLLGGYLAFWAVASWVLFIVGLRYVISRLIADTKDFASLLVSSTAVMISIVTWWYSSVRVNHDMLVAVSNDQEIVEGENPLGTGDYRVQIHLVFLNRGNQAEVTQATQVWLGKLTDGRWISGISSGHTSSGPLIVKAGEVLPVEFSPSYSSHARDSLADVA